VDKRQIPSVKIRQQIILRLQALDMTEDAIEVFVIHGLESLIKLDA
jgi:hypothetical protein